LLLAGLVMSSDSNNQLLVPRILIANDQEWTARSLESILAAEGYEVIRAFTGAQAWERALDTRPDLIILDTQLPDISGPDVCRRLRSHPAVGWSVPVIITTAGSNGRNRVADAMEAGAWDFATQPFDGPILLARIRTFLQSKAAYDASRADATLDSATGLYNRRGLSLRVSELWADARRRREPITCLVISAHPPELVEALEAAEETALSVAQALKVSVRSSDAVARLSPLDFAVMAPNLDRDTALRVLDRFQRHFGASHADASVPMRTGIATLDADEVLDADQLLRRATTAVEWAASDRVATISD
jgi:diguanylate cyclase (GGDEF)-like protein